MQQVLLFVFLQVTHIHFASYLFSIYKGSSIFSITSVQNVRWGEGVPGRCTLFLKFKNDDIISAK